MAGFATHEIFGGEVLREFPQEAALSLLEEHRGVFGVGCQGPDLFLYNLPMLACGCERNLGERMHREATGRFFAYLWQTVWEAPEPLEMEVGLAYLYGALAHYTLDTMLHPYVYARIGYEPGVPYSRKATRGLHHRLEGTIDAKMLAVKRDTLPSRYQPCESMEMDRQEREGLEHILAGAVRRTYKVKLKRENVSGSLALMRLITCSFYGGGEGRRRALERWEGFFSADGLLCNYLVTDGDIRRRKITNREKMPWRNPWDRERVSRDSVWDIYEKAVEQYRKYREEFQALETQVLRRREKLLSLQEVKRRKKGEKKSAASAIMEPCEAGQEKFSEETRRAVRQLGNLSYYSGLPL